MTSCKIIVPLNWTDCSRNCRSWLGIYASEGLWGQKFCDPTTYAHKFDQTNANARSVCGSLWQTINSVTDQPGVHNSSVQRDLCLCEHARSLAVAPLFGRHSLEPLHPRCAAGIQCMSERENERQPQLSDLKFRIARPLWQPASLT